MTQLTARYWRYILRTKGKQRTRELFSEVLVKAEGNRRLALLDIYKEVFYAR